MHVVHSVVWRWRVEMGGFTVSYRVGLDGVWKQLVSHSRNKSKSHKHNIDDPT